MAITNVVLVHGAWVDGSGWKDVYDILVAEGLSVAIVQVPETSFADDVAAVRRTLGLLDGAAVLVGHSYGGALITEAGLEPNVAGLVYVAAHAPDAGENEAALGKATPAAIGKTPGARVTTADGFVTLTEDAFVTLFAPDLPRERALFMARSQVLPRADVFAAAITVPAWRSKPSWGIVAGADQIIHPDLERWYYARAGSRVTEIPGASHAVFVSQPAKVAAVILEAARELQG